MHRPVTHDLLITLPARAQTPGHYSLSEQTSYRKISFEAS